MKMQEQTVHRENSISLDFEMSFATQEDVFRVGEEVLTAAFEKFAPEGYEVTKAPYPIISYKQAMLEFGTDKPDLEIRFVLLM